MAVTFAVLSIPTKQIGMQLQQEAPISSALWPDVGNASIGDEAESSSERKELNVSKVTTRRHPTPNISTSHTFVIVVKPNACNGKANPAHAGKRSNAAALAGGKQRDGRMPADLT